MSSRGRPRGSYRLTGDQARALIEHAEEQWAERNGRRPAEADIPRARLLVSGRRSARVLPHLVDRRVIKATHSATSRSPFRSALWNERRPRRAAGQAGEDTYGVFGSIPWSLGSDRAVVREWDELRRMAKTHPSVMWSARSSTSGTSAGPASCGLVGSARSSVPVNGGSARMSAPRSPCTRTRARRALWATCTRAVVRARARGPLSSLRTADRARAPRRCAYLAALSRMPRGARATRRDQRSAERLAQLVDITRLGTDMLDKAATA